MVRARPKCVDCGTWIKHDLDTHFLYCECPGRQVSVEYFMNGGTPSSWLSRSSPELPSRDGKCTKCGKDLETVGLNRTYPPKRDDMGRVICPHCGHKQETSGFQTYVPTQATTVAQPFNNPLRWPIQYGKDPNPGGFDAD